MVVMQHLIELLLLPQPLLMTHPLPGIVSIYKMSFQIFLRRFSNRLTKPVSILLSLYLVVISMSSFSQQKMTAHFINVGQGDATLLEFTCGAVLIDAGGQDGESDAHLIEYLQAFFDRRTDLNNTIDLVIITHPHIDHNRALDEVVNTFTVKRYIDNGIRRVIIKAAHGSRNFVDFTIAKRIYATLWDDSIQIEGNSDGIFKITRNPLICDQTP